MKLHQIIVKHLRTTFSVASRPQFSKAFQYMIAGGQYIRDFGTWFVKQ